MEQLYVNENFPLPVVKLLREFGHDVLTSADAGNANQRIPDEDVLQFSISQNRILLTLNRRDFIQLHRQNPIHSGIIICTEDVDFVGFTNRIHSVLEENKNMFENQLIRVYKNSQ
jgi:predicted nuclease of predicted toxin-antitoxin system